MKTVGSSTNIVSLDARAQCWILVHLVPAPFPASRTQSSGYRTKPPHKIRPCIQGLGHQQTMLVLSWGQTAG